MPTNVFFGFADGERFKLQLTPEGRNFFTYPHYSAEQAAHRLLVICSDYDEEKEIEFTEIADCPVPENSGTNDEQTLIEHYIYQRDMAGLPTKQLIGPPRLHFEELVHPKCGRFAVLVEQTAE